MPTTKTRIKLTVLALLVFASFITGLFVSQHVPRKKEIDPSQFHGTLLSEPRNISPFRLTGIDQKGFNHDALQGKWTMVFFGFTNCGYVCPTTMAELGKMYRVLEGKGVKNRPNVVMVTIDPKRDSLEKLTHYVKAFHPDFYGARGDDESIQTLTRELGVAYATVTLKGHEGEDNYDIEHTGAVMLFNPQGKLAAFFTTPHQANFLAEDYLLLTT